GHQQTIPLCCQHHRVGGYGVAIHSGKKTWEKKYGQEIDLLNQTLTALGENV
ncbi:hypothetical protein IAI17_35380, partial [Escherichia coli]|nr:hypothetical protein [Escherichia coli]